MTTFILAIVTHTPLWVWGLLATLVALGLRQTREQTLTGARLWTLPLVLSTLSLVGIGQSFGWWSAAQPAWAAGVGLGATASLALGLPRRIHRLADGRFLVLGSWLPLAVIMTIFMLRYALAVALSFAPEVAHSALWATASGAVYGLPGGLYAARAWYVTAQRPLPAACPA